MSRLNERLLETMVDYARRSEPPPPGYSIVEPLRQRLRWLDASARRRLAELPFLLIDVQLTDAFLWQQLLQKTPDKNKQKSRNLANSPQSVAIARGATVMAWHFVHAYPEDAQLHLGASERVVELLRGADPMDLENAAVQVSQTCRPRWSDRPSVWMYLLTEDERRSTSPRDVTVYALQLLGAEATTTTSPKSRANTAAPRTRRTKASAPRSEQGQH
jgi:hypothetical protein